MLYLGTALCIFAVCALCIGHPCRSNFLSIRTAHCLAKTDPQSIAAQIKQMGAYFGVKDDEDLYIWQVPEMALVAPLPPGWSELQPGEQEAVELQFKCVNS